MSQISVIDTVDLATRQVAAISFKNLINKGWGKEDEPQGGFIGESDKLVVKQNILQALVRAPPLVRAQLAECIKSVAYVDYPERWPSLLGDIYNATSGADVATLYGGLTALRVLARKYEFKSQPDREPLNEIVNVMFPVLVQVMGKLTQSDVNAPETVNMMKLVCKTFWSSCYLFVPPILSQPEHFHAWMSLFRGLLAHPPPAHPDAQHAWWKLNKWILHIMNRLFAKYANANALKEDPNQYPFALLFEEHCACQFLEGIMGLLARLPRGEHVEARSINLSLQYMTHALQRKVTYGVMKPHFHDLMFHVLFPLACFQNEDAELWADDPHEYVRKGYDMLEDLYSPRSQVMHFLMDMASFKNTSKDNLSNLVNHLVQIFNHFIVAAQQQGGRNQALERQVDGALLILGSLCDTLKRKAPYKSALEQMLHAFVLPLLNHPAGHLRARAVWTLGMFADCKFQEGRGKGSTFATFMASAVGRLQDPELPVRVDAAVALRLFVEVVKDLELLRPLLPQLLNEFLKLINEVENDDMITTLEALVEKFQDEIAPFAVSICQQLLASFWKSLENDEADDDGMGPLAAMGCLRAVSTILESVASIPEIYQELEPVVLPLLFKLISTEGQDVLEEVLDILNYMVFYIPTISLQMWQVWPLMVEAVGDWAIEYFENVIVPMDTFITRGTEHFLTCKNPDYLNSAYQLVHKLFSMDVLEEDIIPGPKLFECIMLNCKGRVDQYIEPFVMLAVGRLKVAKKTVFKDLLMQTIANALYYNAALCLQILHKHGLVGEVFTMWFQMIWKEKEKKKTVIHFKRENGKKINILGLASLLHVEANQLPPELNAGGGQIIHGVLKLCGDLKELRDSQEGESSEEEESTDDEEGDGDYEPEDDDEEGEEEEDAGRLKASKMRDAKFNEEDEEDSDWDDMYDFWYDEEDDASPIDGVDAHVFFIESLNLLQAKDPARFASYTGALDQSAHQAMHAAYQYAEERKIELSKAAAEEAKKNKQ